jgi:light-regulated signal transduction histidine kinase (bacteriophytochrome)
MIFRKFIGWIVNWLKAYLPEGNKHGKEDNLPYHELQKKVHALEKLVEHMSVENEEIQTAFFRNFYHEIRTPMNSILGFSTLLNSQDFSEERRSVYIEQIWRSSEIFLQFIDDVVEASVLTAQKPVMHNTWFPVNNMMIELYQTCNRYRHLMEHTGVALLLNRTGFVNNLNIYTDRKKIVQLLEYIITGYFAGMEKGIIELGYKTTLNDGLSFQIKTSPQTSKEDLNKDLIFRGGQMNYRIQLRKKMADKLLELFKGTITNETNFMGGFTTRIVIIPKEMSNALVECKSDNNKMAI